MRRRSLSAAVAIAAALALAHGCASLPLPVVDRQLIDAARTAGVEVDRLERGYRLMVTACAACHRPVHPDAVPLSAWNEALPRMLAKARLLPSDGAAIRAYVVAARGAAAPRRDP